MKIAFKKLWICFWLCWLLIASCACSQGRGHSLAAVCGPLMLRLLLLWSRGLGCASFGSCSFQALEHRFNSCGTRTSCSEECGVFLDQGWNPDLLHWQADCSPLSHHGNLKSYFLEIVILVFCHVYYNTNLHHILYVLHLQFMLIDIVSDPSW